MIEGTLNGRYEIKERVGSGGMAEVYRGLDLETGETVAIKVLKQEYSNDPLYLRRLELEARAMVDLKNEHIVSLYGMGSEGDIHYLVLEYINGKTLRDLMDECGKLRPRQAVGIVCDVLDGLAHAHKRGLIHRDVKPQNIMITDSGCIKLTDFGIAKFTGSATKTYGGKEALGSVYYISPEQAKGELVDAQADIYSVGVMLYEMLTGEAPFTGDNAVQIALKHINEPIKPLKEADDSIPVALSDVVARATAKDRSLRYASADDLRRDLKKALRTPLSRFARIKNSEVERSITAPGGEPVKKEPTFLEKYGYIGIILIVATVLTAFILTFILSQSGEDPAYSKVPSFLGYTEEAARTYAENRGFGLEVAAREPSEYPAGEVCAQSPEASSKAKPGAIISVTISTGNETVSVPDLIGKTIDEARLQLQNAGLVLDRNIVYVVDTQPVGTIIGQSLNPGEIVMIGDSVSVTVASETEVAGKMPDLTGKTIEQAAKLLSEANITDYRFVPYDYGEQGQKYADLTVVSQSPDPDAGVINGAMSVLVFINSKHLNDYKAEFSENVTLTGETNEITVTVVTNYGEVQLFDRYSPAGSISVPFTGHYWEQGSFNCILYVNGKVEKTFVRSFE